LGVFVLAWLKGIEIQKHPLRVEACIPQKKWSFFACPPICYHPRANQVASLFAPDAELAPFEKWVMDLHYRKGKSALKLVKTALSDFLPGAEFQTIDKENRRLMFKTEDGTIPLAVLSDGFQNAISWCGDLLYRLTKIFEDYQKPLNARGLLLIDEIGLHLNLSWQRRLREYISKKFPNLQIIATTHSPFAAHQAGEGELFSLVRDDDSQRAYAR
jgi:hypothetical protein